MGDAQTKIGTKELVSMLTLYVSVNLFLNYPQTLAKSGMQASWMEPITSGIWTLLLFLVVERLLFHYFPGLDIVEVAKETFGKTAAVLIAVVFGLYFVAVTAAIMRQFTENVATSVLPTTPIILISLLFILSVGYVSYHGIEAIARTSYFALPILITGVLAICIFTVNWWQPTDLFPFWGTGVTRIGIGTLKYSSIFANVLLLCVIYPHARNPKSLRMAGVVSITLSTILLAGFNAAYVMVFPASEAAKISFPLYQLARMIFLGHFFQNLESGFIFMWVTAAVLNMATTLWGAAYLFSSAFSWPTFRPSIPALGLFSFALSLIPNNVLEVEAWHENYILSWGGIVVFGLPLLIMVVSAILKSRKQGRAEHV